MESGSTIRRKEKCHKSIQMANTTSEEDIISSKLPESLISHILSLLPTKDAVRTCVLSKTWINRWISITKLDLDDSVFKNTACSYCKNVCTEVFYVADKYALVACSMCYCRHNNDRRWEALGVRQVMIKEDTLQKQQQFVNFVFNTLLLTGTKSSISSMELESFSLVIYYKHDVSHLNAWIFNILTRRVKYLRIHSSFYKLPFSALTSHYLFNSTLLEELDLVLHMFSTIQVPTISLRFGHLKLLKLSGIFFNIDPSFDHLTLSLPVLKKIELGNCTWSSGKHVIVEAPLLETVSIEQDLHKLVSHDPYSCAIKFSTLDLKEFTYCGGYGISQKILLSDHSFLSFAAVQIILKQCENENKVSETRCLAFFLLQQFHQVKCIKFEGLEVLSQADIHVFAKLSHLELGLVTIEVLLVLLQKSPILETLVLKDIPKFAKEVLNSAIVPDCLASTLKVVKFEKVNGEEHELILAKFFMENGMMLERMSFSLANQRLRKSKVMEEFEKKLYSFKKYFSLAIV